MKRTRVGLVGCALALAPACTPVPRMCNAAGDCANQAECVGGRCLRRGAIAALTTAQRRTFAPEDVGYVARGRGAGRAPALVTLGKGDGAVALLRFAVALPADAVVVEAYLLMERANVATDPLPLALHAAAVTEPWEGASVTFPLQPALEEIGAPVTRVPMAPGGALRLDVRAIVERWQRRRKGDFGIAVLSQGTSPSGVTLALGPVVGRPLGDDVVLSAFGPFPPADPATTALPAEVAGAPERETLGGPELELYVK